MLFYTLFGLGSRLSSNTYLLTEWTKQLALAAESPDPLIGHWSGDNLLAFSEGLT
jgi:hypothetical protein